MTAAPERRPVVLLVDDEERILSALLRSLRREGYELVTAEHGRAALKLLEHRRVDAIVTDHKMPGMSGLDFLAEVESRGIEAARILLTGWPEEIPAQRRAALRIEHLLPKPWDDGHLKEVLRASLA